MKKILKDIRNRVLGINEIKAIIQDIYGQNEKLVIPKDDLINVVKDLLMLIKEDYPTSEGHDILAALTILNQMPLPYGVDDIPHAISIPKHGTYAPWKIKDFYNDVLQEINPPYYLPNWQEKVSFTLVDIYRIYGLYQGLMACKHLTGDVIEIGAYKGGTAAFIGNVLKTEQIKSHLFVADTYEGVVNASPDYDPVYQGGEHADTSVEDVTRLLNKFCAKDSFSIIKGIFPDSAPEEFKNRKVKFCHIDVDVYSGSVESYSYLYPLMDSGAVAIFDDFATQGIEGVTRAVRHIKNNFDVNVFHMFQGQAMVIKR